MFERYQPDLGAYVGRVRTGPCFVCAILARDPAFPDHHIIYEDEDALRVTPTSTGTSCLCLQAPLIRSSSSRETAGVLKLPDGEKASLAARIGQRMERP